MMLNNLLSINTILRNSCSSIVLVLNKHNVTNIGTKSVNMSEISTLVKPFFSAVFTSLDYIKGCIK